MVNVIPLRSDQGKEGVLRVPALEFGEPLTDLRKIGVTRRHKGVDPKQVWIKADGFFRQSGALTGVIEPDGAEGQPFGIALPLGLPSEGFQARLAVPWVRLGHPDPGQK